MPRAEKIVRTEQEMRRRRMMPSDRQEQILRFARLYQKQNGYPASRAEIARELGITEASINHQLSQLTKKGWVSVDAHVQRGIVLLREGVPLIDAATGAGLDETDPDRPRINGLEAVFGEEPDLFVRVGNNTMGGAGVYRGYLMAIAQNREPEHGDLVAAQIDDVVEVRRFVRSSAGDMLEAEPEPEKWVVHKGKRVQADAENVTMLGVEIACMVTAQHGKQRERERIRERRGRGRER